MTVYICDQKTPDCAASRLYPSGIALNGCGTYCEHTTNLDYAKRKGGVPRTFIILSPGVLQEVIPKWKENQDV